MTIEKNHIENFLYSSLLLRNYAGDFTFLESVYNQQNSENLNEISAFTALLNKATKAVFRFADEVKENGDLELNHFLISWLKLGSDLDEVLEKLQALKFLDESQKNNAISGILQCREIFVRDFLESLLVSIGRDKAYFLVKATVLK